MPPVFSKDARPTGPPAKRQKKSSGRHEGHELAWYRLVNNDGSSTPASSDTPGRKKDARILRLIRNGGFRRAESEEAMLSENPLLAAYLNKRSDTNVRDQINNSHRATAILEQYTLKHVKTGQFLAMLVAIDNLFDEHGELIDEDRNNFPQYVPPEDVLIEAFVEHLRAKPPDDDDRRCRLTLMKILMTKLSFDEQAETKRYGVLLVVRLVAPLFSTLRIGGSHLHVTYFR